MESFCRNSNFETGLQEVDDQHRRLGGDEFFIICSFTPLEGSLHIAEMTRANIAALHVPAGTGVWQGSISVGVAVNISTIASIEDLMKAADEGVYMAKKAGRNCVRSRQASTQGGGHKRRSQD